MVTASTTLCNHLSNTAPIDEANSNDCAAPASLSLAYIGHSSNVMPSASCNSTSVSELNLELRDIGTIFACLTVSVSGLVKQPTTPTLPMTYLHLYPFLLPHTLSRRGLGLNGNLSTAPTMAGVVYYKLDVSLLCMLRTSILRLGTLPLAP